jgi:hypothetical protein
MHLLCFLIGLALVAEQNWCGQADPWYARGCLAREYIRRWWQIRDPSQWMYQQCIHQSYRQLAWEYGLQLSDKHFSAADWTAQYPEPAAVRLIGD